MKSWAWTRTSRSSDLVAANRALSGPCVGRLRGRRSSRRNPRKTERSPARCSVVGSFAVTDQRRPNVTKSRELLDSPPLGSQHTGFRPRKHPVTICIAAICQSIPGGPPCVIGATDRKVTAGDIQFEPPMSKIWQLASGVVALVAGDSDAQSEICSYVLRKQPQDVVATVRAYCDELGKYNRRQAERAILFPLGMNMKSFLSSQKGMSPDFIEQIRYEIKKERAEIKTIICGVDHQFGAQIFVVDWNSKAYSNSSIGFAAIGDGEWHASSQFMFSKYVPTWSLVRSMLLVYSAKQRAQVAPGVGEDTDLFFVSQLHGFSLIQPPIPEELQKAYEKMRNTYDKAVEESYSAMESYVSQLTQKAADQAPEDHGPSPHKD